MNSIDIIERLLDQRSISAKEAMIILKDLVRNGTFTIWPNTADGLKIEDNKMYIPQTINWSSSAIDTNISLNKKFNAPSNNNYAYGKNNN